MNWIYAHLIGDYLFQNDWMANGKKKASWICAVHVLTYLVPFAFIGSYFYRWGVHIELFLWPWWKFALIGVQHFAQDRTGFVVWLMKVKGSGAFVKPPMGPWSVVVTDNILHILWMALVASL